MSYLKLKYTFVLNEFNFDSKDNIMNLINSDTVEMLTVSKITVANIRVNKVPRIIKKNLGAHRDVLGLLHRFED